MNKLRLLIFLIFGFSFAQSASEPPTWSVSNSIQAGYKTIVQNQVHQSNDNLYTYTYSPAFATTPFTALGVIAFEANDLHTFNLKFLVNIPNYMSTTSLQIRMNYPTATDWRYFKVSYIAVDSSFTDLRVDYFSRNNPANVGSGIGERIFSGTFNLNIAPMDMTHQNSIMPLLVGIDARSINGQHTVYWSTKLKNSTTIDYQLKVKRTTQVLQFVSYILIVDRTSVSTHMEKYIDEIYVSGQDNVPDYQTPTFYSTTNFHAGLNSFNFQLVAFSFDKNSFSLTSDGFYNDINITVWNFRQRHCSVSFPYYQQNSNLCYDSCPDGYVNEIGITKKYCATCDNYKEGCQLCSTDGTVCDKCWGHYQLNLFTNICQCPQGFYISNLYRQYVDICRPCHQFCQTCNGPNPDNCLSCGRFRSMNGSTCTCDYGARPNGKCYGPCDDLGCLVCDADVSICEQCDSSLILSGSRCICGPKKYYDLYNGVCEDCHYTCQYCNGPGDNECSTCDRENELRFLQIVNSQCLCISNYEDINETCVPSTQIECLEEGYELDQSIWQCKQICGDGLLKQLQCDDANKRNGDGCSDSCLIEQGFICADNSLAPTRRSYCSFAEQIEFVLNRTQKHIYKNQLNLTYTMKPNLHHVLQVYPELSQYIQFQPSSLKVKTLAAQYLVTEKVLLVQVEYGEHLHSQNLTIVFKIPQTAETFAVHISRSTHQIQPDNNLAALYHDQSTYKQVRASGIIGKIAYIGGLIVAALLFFFRKMIGLQFICMMQLIYFSSLISDFSHPMLGPLQQWHYINGYNNMTVGIEDVSFVQNEWRVLGYKNFFFANFNVMLFVSLCIYGLALILLVLSMISDRTTQRKLKDASLFFGLEIGFAFMVFSLSNIMVSVIMEYQSDTLLSFDNAGNKLILILALLLVILHCAFFFVRAHQFSDSMVFYHRHKSHTHFFPMGFVARNMMLMIVIILEQQIGQISTHFCLGIQAIYVIAVVTAKPYRKNIDYVRFGGVQATLFINLIYRFIDANFISSPYDKKISGILNGLVYLILTGFLFSWVMTIASFIYHFWKGKTKQVEVLPQDEYVPPVIVSPKKDKAKSKEIMRDSHSKLQEPQKSREFVIYDIEDDNMEENTGGSEGALDSNYFNENSRRKFRPKKSSQYT